MMEGPGSGLSSVFFNVYFSKDVFKSVFFKSIFVKSGVVARVG